jgi:hypothetical protein
MSNGASFPGVKAAGTLRISGTKPPVPICCHIEHRTNVTLIINLRKMRWKRRVSRMEYMKILTAFYAEVLMGRDCFKT